MNNAKKSFALMIIFGLLIMPGASWAGRANFDRTRAVVDRLATEIGGYGQSAAGSALKAEKRLFKDRSEALARAGQLLRYPHEAGEILVRRSGKDGFERLAVPSGVSLQEFLADELLDQTVTTAEPNYLAQAFFVPNDTFYSYQWHMDNSSGSGVNAEQAWDLANGTGAVVAVIDTGIAYETFRKGGKRYYLAPDLAGTTFVPGFDFVENDTHPNDDNRHGTHVAGTIAQTTNNGKGVAGLAYGAALMPIKVLDRHGSGTYADVADGIRWAVDHGAQVLNLSLGGSAPSVVLQDAVAYAKAKGAVIVAAAGNDGDNNVSYPARYPETVAVGATRYDENLAYYSNYGPDVDLVAPGGDLTVDQNGDGYGDGVLQQTFASSFSRFGNFGYYFFQGTSMATPHVAAAAALLVSAGVTNPDDVQNILQATAQDLGAAGRDDVFGWGLIDAFGALQAVGGFDLPPSVILDTPADGSQVSGLVTVSATATDDNAVSRVDFYVDNTLLASDAAAPYTVDWDSTTVIDGSHMLSATAVDSANQTATANVSVTTENVNDPPVADAGPDQNALVNETVFFSGAGSFDPEGGALNFAWNFGDGASASGMNVNHVFGVAGSYTVTLTVTDPGLLSDTDTLLVTVSDAPAADVSLTDVSARNTRVGRDFKVQADVLNNGPGAVNVTGSLVITDPNGNLVNWPGMADQTITIADGLEETIQWRGRVPSDALRAKGYLATVTIFLNGVQVGQDSDDFRVR